MNDDTKAVNKGGRPKGSKNKRTLYLERIGDLDDDKYRKAYWRCEEEIRRKFRELATGAALLEPLLSLDGETVLLPTGTVLTPPVIQEIPIDLYIAAELPEPMQSELHKTLAPNMRNRARLKKLRKL